jgi:hypothetical protein
MRLLLSKTIVCYWLPFAALQGQEAERRIGGGWRKEAGGANLIA